MPALRFLLACISLFLAAFVFLPTPTILLFQFKLCATEFGHWLVLLPALVIIMGRRRSRLDSISVLMAVAAAFLFSSTAVRAAIFAKEAEKSMRAAFPLKTGATTGRPFSFRKLWSLSHPRPSKPETMIYSRTGGQDLALDFYAPEERKNAPCVLVLHSGGWDSGERNEFVELNEDMASKGYAVASIDYRLAPTWPWPAQLEDTLAAIGFLRDRADLLGIDATKFVMAGRSAGGQIAEAAAVAGNKHGIIGCIALYAPADLNFAYQYADKKDVLNSEMLLRQYLGGTPAEVKAKYDGASPYLSVSDNTPPVLLIHGVQDELVWTKQSERYAARLRENHVRHVFLRVPWATHALDYSWNSPGGQLTSWAVEHFLAAFTE